MFKNTLAFAREMDRKDPLKKFRNEFLIPSFKKKPAIYFLGNSLGLQPKRTEKFLTQELQDWAALGVEGHFRARRPWLHYHTYTKKMLAKLTGAKTHEVVAMNHLTVNLHLMLVTFYNPTAKRFKIITEKGGFPSDQYALESQIKFHGLDPDKVLIEVSPREGEFCLRMEDIIKTIEYHGDETALVFFSGIQYYTGQVFNLKKITEAGHRVGAFVGFDLAHAIGNVPLRLHPDGVDFAIWCSYKYLNSGSGGIGGAFIHEQNTKREDLKRFAGWWGYKMSDRFKMQKGFVPMEGVDGWQLSTVPVFQSAAHLASLTVFEEATLPALRKKSILLTGYLEFLLRTLDPNENHFSILTPKQKNEHGCQLSLYMKHHGKEIYTALHESGVFADWREPNVIRVAPTPLYNRFEEVYSFVQILRTLVDTKKLRL